MARKADPNQTDMFVSDTRPHRYTIVIHPGFQISEKVKQFKHHLHNIVTISEKDLHSKPHITLCYLDKNYSADDLIVKEVKSVLSGLKSIEIKVDGFDYWDSGTFFMKLKDQGPIYRLIIDLQEKLNVSQGKAPHITIASGLKKKDFDGLTAGDFEYEASFSCNSLTILKQVLNDPDAKPEVLEKLKFPG